MMKRAILGFLVTVFVSSCSSLFYPVDENQDNIRIHFSNMHFGNTGSTTIYEDDVVQIKYFGSYGRINQNKVRKSSGAYEEVRALLDQIYFFEMRATCREATEGEINFYVYNPDASNLFITLIENGVTTTIVEGCGIQGWTATPEYVESWNLLYQRITEISEATAY